MKFACTKQADAAQYRFSFYYTEIIHGEHILMYLPLHIKEQY